MRVAVIGASFAGLLAGVAAARSGHRVTVVERDALPDLAEPRPGVPQSAQPHVLLRRGLLAIDALLPGTSATMIERGGVTFSTGQMPWLGEFGWIRPHDFGHEIICLTRPLLEQVVRERAIGVPGLQLRDQTTVRALRPGPDGWRLITDGAQLTADLVIDAAGRSSRLPHWLDRLGVAVAAPEEVDARVGYASRLYRGRLPLRTGLVIEALPDDPRGGMLLPMQDDGWLVLASGLGDDRPGRSVTEYETFLGGQRDPALAAAITRLEPAGEVTTYRQTGNRRYDYGRHRDWPAGLLVVGDAACSFNPLYGQGITVAALQAERLAEALRTAPSTSATTRRVQRRLAAVADFPWSVATEADRRLPSCVPPSTARPNPYIRRIVQLATRGDPACAQTFADVYHLIGQPRQLFSPAVVLAVLRSVVRGLPAPPPRPAVLADLLAA